MNECLVQVKAISKLDNIEETAIRCMLIKTQLKALEVTIRPFIKNPETVISQLMEACKIEERKLDG